MDARVNQIFWEETFRDKSFREKKTAFSLLFGERKYTQEQVRKVYHDGIKRGIEVGLYKASLDGQRKELNLNTNDPKHKEFLEKFYRLAEEYSCSIQYHPLCGMAVISNKSQRSYSDEN